jgi:CubicO group peptidase (beta-lactamase class C family)
MLVDEGRLGLDDPINRYFPGAPATWKAITVRHLLTHTSGIKDWEGKTDLDYRKDYTEDELVQVAMKLPPDFAPVTQWSYSNTGYVLLGILVHKVSGKFYGDFLTAGVGLPLAQHHRRRLALHHDPRHGDVGRRPLGTTLPQAGELPGNVVTREAAGQHHLSLRVRVGVRRAAARAGDQAHRFLAGVQDGDRSLPRPQAHRDRPGQPRPGRAGAPGHRGCRPRGARAKAGREDLQNQLATATGFTFLAEDDEKGRGLELRGEPISSVAFCFMPGQRDRRYRFFLNDNGEVADFSSEIVD